MQDHLMSIRIAIIKKKKKAHKQKSAIEPA